MSSVLKNYRLVLLFVGFIHLSFGSLSGQEKVNWISFEEMMEKQETSPKKVFIDIYTDWCGWCKKMDKATFQQPHIAKYLNENYYSVKFDAEQKKAINWKGKEYKFVQSGRKGYNAITIELTRGKLSYPTVVFMDENQEIIQPIPGYRAPKEFEMIMKYFGENHHQTTSWKNYTELYNANGTNNPTQKKMSQPVKYNKN